MFRRVCILWALMSLIACAPQKPAAPSSSDVQNIKNSDVRWDGNVFGLYPNFSGASKKIIDDRPANFDELVAALDDEDRYIAAHALLSRLSGHLIGQQAGGIDPVTGNALPATMDAIEKFNGLRVDLLADGTVVIPTNQQSEIASKWKAWLKSTK